MTERPSSKKKNKNSGGMFNYLLHAVDKVFYHVYDGEPVRRKRTGSTNSILEEEVIFCKNNVCVKVKNERDDSQMDEIAGYMNMKKIYRSDCEFSDLILSWVPNKLLSAGSVEEAEIMLPPAPTEQINPLKEPSKYSSEVIKDPDSVDGELDAKTDFPEVAKDFDSPLGNVFGINLIDMKTVKLFYSSLPGSDAGQFVIGSHDNEYKVFYFHNGGLHKIADIFDTWNGCEADPDLIPEEDGQKVYYITGEHNVGLDSSSKSPNEEGRYKALNMHNWMTFMNPLGQIEDSYNFRKHVFFGGLSHEVRPDAWKFLLYYHPLHSTRKERDAMKDEKTKVYEAIHNKRLSLSGEDYEIFWKNVQFTVDKDVVRTDRSHPYYAGQDNPNIQKMRNILLNYAVYNPAMGYSQGMSDLVAPVLATLHDEVDCFWCFVGLMESSMFATTPRDDSMDKSLGFFRELLRLIKPEFYLHCLCTDPDMELLFAHRWLVLCFKREFIFHEVLNIWEACWSRYQTDYFHIFICVAMCTTYGAGCMEKKMDSVEMLQYFTEMATKFDGSTVLKEARSILHKFRQFNKIPCTLKGLMSTKGVWDGGILPEIECISHHRRCCQDLASPRKVADDVTGEIKQEGSGKMKGEIDEIRESVDGIDLEHVASDSNVVSAKDDGDSEREDIEAKTETEILERTDNINDLPKRCNDEDKTITSLEGAPNTIDSELTVSCDVNNISGDDKEACKLVQRSQKYLDTDCQQEKPVNEDTADTDSDNVEQNVSRVEDLDDKQSANTNDGQSNPDSSFEGAQII